MKPVKTLNYLEKLEPLFFYVVLLFSIYPILTTTFFPTLDGPAHLYNSTIIRELTVENEAFTSFFKLNNQVIPNWTGHGLLVLLNTVFPLWLSEKIIVLIYMIGLPLAFRSLVARIALQKPLFSYFIFPFVFAFPFSLGFYNFSIALVLLFFTLHFWIKTTEIRNWRKFIQLFFLVVLTYFSHAFVFIILLLFMGLYIIYTQFNRFLSEETSCSKHFNDVIKKVGYLLLISCIPLILLVQNFHLFKSGVGSTYLTAFELLKWLKHLRPIISYHEIIEGEFTHPLFYVLLGLGVIGGIAVLVNIWGNFKTNTWKSRIKSFVELINFWGICSVVLLILYFILPDGDTAAGFVSVRLGLLFFLFLLLWIATLPINKWITLLAVSYMLFLNFGLQRYHKQVITDLDKIAVGTESVSKYIPKNSLVLPINATNNWILGHFSNYLCTKKPILILENYEAGTGYFPVLWNSEKIPNVQLIDGDSTHCMYWQSNAANKIQLIDFVLVQGVLDTANACHNELQEKLSRDFNFIHKNQYCTLFKRK